MDAFDWPEADDNWFNVKQIEIVHPMPKLDSYVAQLPSSNHSLNLHLGEVIVLTLCLQNDSQLVIHELEMQIQVGT